MNLAALAGLTASLRFLLDESVPVVERLQLAPFSRAELAVRRAALQGILAVHLLDCGFTPIADAPADVGDTVMFQAHAPHRYSGLGSAEVRFVMVVLQPGDAGLVPPTSIAEAGTPPPAE